MGRFLLFGSLMLFIFLALSGPGGLGGSGGKSGFSVITGATKPAINGIGNAAGRIMKSP